MPEPPAPDLRVIRPPGLLPRVHSPEAVIQGSFLRVGDRLINLANVTSIIEGETATYVHFSGDDVYDRFEGTEAAALHAFLARHVTEVTLAPAPAPEAPARPAGSFPTYTSTDRVESVRTAWPGFATPRCCREMPMPDDAALDEAALQAAVEHEAEAIYDAMGPAADDPAEFPKRRGAVPRDFVRQTTSE